MDEKEKVVNAGKFREYVSRTVEEALQDNPEMIQLKEVLAQQKDENQKYALLEELLQINKEQREQNWELRDKLKENQAALKELLEAMGKDRLIGFDISLLDIKNEVKQLNGKMAGQKEGQDEAILAELKKMRKSNSLLRVWMFILALGVAGSIALQILM